MKTKYFQHKLLAVALFAMASLFSVHKSFAQGSQTFTNPGTTNLTTTFTAPVGVTSITVEVWGGGGAGGGGNTVAAGGGGGGGYKKMTNVSVAPGTSYTIVIGAGGVGAAATGQPGGTSSGTFGITLVSATGGAGGIGGAPGAGGGGGTGGTGGFIGGSGAPGVNLNHSGGGGSSAGPGPTGNGVNGNTSTSATGGLAVTGGGAGANGVNGTGNGSAGSAPGGGGSGAINFGATTGGSGGNGQVRITWTCPLATISYSTSSLCGALSTSLPVNQTGLAGGTYSATPAGLSINTSTGEINPSTSTPATYTVHYQVAGTGGNGCTAIDAIFSITIFGSPKTTINAQTNITCNAAGDGTITVLASGGTAPYKYAASADGITYNFITPSPASTNPYTITGLGANQPYHIKVQDSNGCISR